MGAKKKDKKGGKKGKKGATEFDLTVEESNMVLEAMKDSLAAKLISEGESADKCKASENEKRFRELQLQRKVKEEQKKQMDIISDMTRQYKSVEEELMDKIKKLERRQADNQQKI